MDKIEKNWVSEVEKSNIEISKVRNDGKQILFNEKTIGDLAANLIVNDCASALNILLKESQLKEKIILLQEKFSASFTLFINLIGKFRDHNFLISNPNKKRWNLI